MSYLFKGAGGGIAGIAPVRSMVLSPLVSCVLEDCFCWLDTLSPMLLKSPGLKVLKAKGLSSKIIVCLAAVQKCDGM